jgi:hypothetical protein
MQLYAGWNLVGCYYTTAKPIDEAISSLSGKCVSVWTYDATAGEWQRYVVNGPAFLNNLVSIGPRKAYWVKVTEDCSWSQQ